VSLVSGLFYCNFYISAKWPSLRLLKTCSLKFPLPPFELKKEKLVYILFFSSLPELPFSDPLIVLNTTLDKAAAIMKDLQGTFNAITFN
jgi:hypothetical protein